jgi:hypothetical protein
MGGSSVRQPERGGLPVWGLYKGLRIPHFKKKTACYEVSHRASDLAGCCEHGNMHSGSIEGGEFLE